MASRPPDDEARKRWMFIQLMRVGGFAFAILGLLMTQNAVIIAGENNELVGYGFLLIGLLDGFVVPQVLARKWRSPPE